MIVWAVNVQINCLLSRWLKESDPDLTDIYIFYAFYVLIALNLILSTFSERFSRMNQKYFKENKKVSAFFE